VPFQNVRLSDDFFAPRIETNRKDDDPRRASTSARRPPHPELRGRVGQGRGEARRSALQRLDVYKVLEGAAYALKSAPDPALEKRVDAIVDSIAARSARTATSDTYFQLVEPEMKWKKESDGHELYCAAT
jgi:DUF1680 family protein